MHNELNKQLKNIEDEVISQNKEIEVLSNQKETIESKLENQKNEIKKIIKEKEELIKKINELQKITNLEDIKKAKYKNINKKNEEMIIILKSEISNLKNKLLKSNEIKIKVN